MFTFSLTDQVKKEIKVNFKNQEKKRGATLQDPRAIKRIIGR